MSTASLQRVFKTLTDPTRVRVLFLLDRAELAVQELVQVLDTAQSTVSRHLGILREAGLVADRKDGTSTYYRIQAPAEGPQRECWRLCRQALEDDPGTARDLAALDLVLRQRELSSRRWFEKIGPEWDSIRRVFNDDVHRARAVSRLLPKGLRVADIGTGTGILARELAQAGAEVVAIDHSDRMISAAADQVRDPRITFALGEANDLPLEDETMDAAMAHMVLHYVAAPQDVLREMARVVRPGGRVILVDFVQHEASWMREELGVLWQGFAPESIEQWLGDVGLHEVEIEIDQPETRGGSKLPATFIAAADKPRAPLASCLTPNN